MTWIQLVQWLLLIWLVSVFLRSLLEIFKLDRLDHIVTGLLFVLIGLAWIATLQWHWKIQQIFNPYFVQSSIGLLLTAYGIRMIWKKPIGSAIACIVILLVSGFLYYHTPDNANSQPSLLNRYIPFLSSYVIPENEKIIDQPRSFGMEEDEKLEIHSQIGNLFFSSSSLKELFSVITGSVEEDSKQKIYQIGSSEEKTSLQIRNRLEELIIKKDVGNIQGTLDGKFGSVSVDSDAGNVQLDLKDSIGSFSCRLNMGNLDLNLYTRVPTVNAKVDVGNITIHIAKGLRIETDSVKTSIGQVKILQNGDGSVGSIELKAECNIGNITIIADL